MKHQQPEFQEASQEYFANPFRISHARGPEGSVSNQYGNDLMASQQWRLQRMPMRVCNKKSETFQSPHIKDPYLPICFPDLYQILNVAGVFTYKDLSPKITLKWRYWLSGLGIPSLSRIQIEAKSWPIVPCVVTCHMKQPWNYSEDKICTVYCKYIRLTANNFQTCIFLKQGTWYSLFASSCFNVYKKINK